MIYSSTIISLLEIVIIILPILLIVAFVTVAERKTMGAMQRRLGPNAVGYYGLLQAFADALKLLLKEYVSPTQSNLVLFFIGPIVTLIFALLGFAVIPFGPGLSLMDFNLGILYMLAMSSLGTYGILLAGWSANSKYAFLGSLRSTAQLISYELILSSAILLVILLTTSLNLTSNIESQKAVWFLFPLLPIFIIFFIGSVAETNRAPFDLAEAESELVSGFMTEHAAVIFVFFFLAEYASIVLICILITVLFLGGYLFDLNSFQAIFKLVINQMESLYDLLINPSKVSETNEATIWVVNSLPFPEKRSLISSTLELFNQENFFNQLLEGGQSSLTLGIKTSLLVFIFIWVRASLPRIRFDQLMSSCWTILLPLIFAFIFLIPSIILICEIMPTNNLY